MPILEVHLLSLPRFLHRAILFSLPHSGQHSVQTLPNSSDYCLPEREVTGTIHPISKNWRQKRLGSKRSPQLLAINYRKDTEERALEIVSWYQNTSALPLLKPSNFFSLGSILTEVPVLSSKARASLNSPGNARHTCFCLSHCCHRQLSLNKVSHAGQE